MFSTFFKRNNFKLLLLFLAVGLMGINYGMWNSNLNISAEANTGKLDLELNDNNYESDIEIINSISQTIAISIKNTGDINAKLKNIIISPDYCSTTGSAISINYDNDIVNIGESLSGQIIINPDFLQFQIKEETENNKIYESIINISFNFSQSGLEDSGWTKTVDVTLNIIKTECTVVTIPPSDTTTNSAIESTEVEKTEVTTDELNN